jgi:hypothetical protein
MATVGAHGRRACAPTVPLRGGGSVICSTGCLKSRRRLGERWCCIGVPLAPPSALDEISPREKYASTSGCWRTWPCATDPVERSWATHKRLAGAGRLCFRKLRSQSASPSAVLRSWTPASRSSATESRCQKAPELRLEGAPETLTSEASQTCGGVGTRAPGRRCCLARARDGGQPPAGLPSRSRRPLSLARS